MFDHRKMREARFAPEDKGNPTPVETTILEVREAFGQLQADRHRADYDLGWQIAGTDVAAAINRAGQTIIKWRSIRNDDLARHHLLSMFGASR